MKDIRAKVNNIINFARRLHKVKDCYSNGRYDINALMGLFSLRFETKVVVVKEQEKLFLLVYQRGKEEPDYTINLRERR